MVENIKDISYLILSLFSVISLYDPNIISYRIMFYALCLYTLCDLIFFKLTKDVYVHHTLVFSIFLLDWLYYETIDTNINDIFNKICLYFEVSSVFLAFISIFKKSENILIKKYKLIDITNIVFYGFFIYYRLYYFSQIFVFNNDLHIPLFDYCNNKQNITHKDVCLTQFYGTFFGFALLNIYWFHLMTKIMVKSSGLKSIINKIKTSTYENILGYTLYIKSLSVTISYLVYYNFYKKIEIEHDHYIDIISIIALSIASMYCHHTWKNVYKKIEKKEDINDKDIYRIKKWTFYDQLCIHIRSSAIIYGIYGNSLLFYTSLLFHILTSKQLYDDMYDNKIINKDIHIDKMISYINNSVHFNLGATFLYDNVLVSFYNVFDYHCQFNLFICMFIAASFYIRPFYEANQIYVHTLLIIQTIILSILNVKY